MNPIHSAERSAGLSEGQIMYLRDVLGVQGFLIPLGFAVPNSVVSNSSVGPASVVDLSHGESVREAKCKTVGLLESSRLMVLTASSGHSFVFERDAEELSRKMIQAMKLSPKANVTWVEWTEMGHARPPQAVLELLSQCQIPVLVFGADTLKDLIGRESAHGEWVEWKGVRFLSTYRLEEILARPGLKKAVWTHLQTVMKALS